MTFSTNAGAPVAFGKGQTADDRALFLKQFGGEVLTSYTAQTLTAGKVRERVISSGKSALFPKTGVSTAEYMTRGQEAMGNPFETGEVEITVDGLLSASHSLWDLDTLMSHFDVRGPMTADMGAALARVYDKNNFRQIALAARTAAAGIFPGGTVIADAGLLGAGAVDGKAWMDKIRAAKLALLNKNIPANTSFYMVVPFAVLDALKYAIAAAGVYLNLNSQIAGASAGTMAEPTESIRYEGVTIYGSALLPNTDESADTTVWAKYRASYAKTTGLMWTPDAVGVLKLKGMGVETFRDVRRQENFIIATMATGHGTLRPECAVEFKTV